MTENPNRTKLVKIQLKRDCLIQNAIHKAGKTLEVSEEDADEFCKQIQGLPSFEGERSNPQYHSIQRAVRL
jgi:hypothetical protein